MERVHIIRKGYLFAGWVRVKPRLPGYLPRTESQRGFSLIEVLTIIGIVSIIAGISIPSFSGWIDSNHLKNAANELVSSLQTARMKAINQNANCVISFNLAQPGSYLIFVDNGAGGGTAKNWIKDGSEELIKSVALALNSPGVTLTNASFSGSSSYGFTPMGFSFGNRSGSLILQNQRGNTKQINLSIGGCITLQ